MRLKKEEEKRLEEEAKLEEELQRAHTLQETLEKSKIANRKRKQFNVQHRKSKKQKNQHQDDIVKTLIQQLNEEPSNKDIEQKLGVTLRIRLPNGEHITRSFFKNELLEQVFIFIQSSYPFLINNPFLLMSMYPRTIYDNQTSTLEDNGICNSLSLFVELKV